MLLIRHLNKPFINLEMDLDPATSSVKMDSTQMQRVLSAAVFNASEPVRGTPVKIYLPCDNTDG